MADSIPRTPATLASAIDTFVAALGTDEGKAASKLTDDDLSDLSKAAGRVRTATDAKVTAEKAYRKAVRAEEMAVDEAEDLFRPARREANNSRAMTDDLRAAAGLSDPVAAGGTGTLPTVTDLTALVRPSGAVFLDWTGPSGGSLRYEVFALSLDEDGGEWQRLGAASATDYTDREALPGARTSYRVQAVRGERAGEVSNVASSNP